jgi:hypothetical protein
MSYMSPGSDRVRIIFLVCITLIVVSAFVYFKYTSSSRQQDDTDTRESDYINAPPSRVEVYADVKPELLAEVRDGSVAERVVKEKDPFLHLLCQSAKLIPGDMELLGVESADPEAIREDPTAFRGKPLSIKGNLQWYESEHFEEFKFFRGYLTTLEGQYVYFTVLGMPDEFAIGDVVKLQGYFFKVFSFTLPGEETRVSDALFLVGRRLITSFYKMDPVHEIDQNLLDTIYDYTLEDSSKEFPEKPLYHLLSYVQNLDDEEIAKVEFQELLASELMQKAGKFRGKPVDIVGHPVWLRNNLLGPAGENPLSGVKKTNCGLLLNYKGGFCYFYALDVPDWFSTDFKDLVHIKGFFFRNYSYTTRKGNPQSAPTVIVCDIEKFVYAEDNTMLYITFFVFGLTILIVGFFFITVFRDRKHNREYRTRFIEKKKELLKRALAQNAAASESAERGDPPANPG